MIGIIENIDLALAWKEILNWFAIYFLSYKGLVELALVVLITFTAYFLSKRLNVRVTDIFSKQKARRVISKKAILFLQTHMLGIIAGFLFALFMIPFSMLKVPAYLLSSFAILISSWVIVNLLTDNIENRLLSRFVAIVTWSIAVLSLLGLYGKMVKILDSVFVTLGSVRISPYLLIKGTITIVILMWLAKVLSSISEKTIVRSKSLSPSLRVLSSKMIRVFAYSVALLIGLNGIGVNLAAFTIFSGAVGVGVGFGLQKIVGNIVSGFIVLMDDSIKPGDIIQLDDKFGTVERMGARYISVVAWDGMEHLIPNEDIITSKVINWTHSNKRILVTLDVGVAYKSDVHLVEKLLLEAAASFPRILTDPPVNCYLTGFGASSVDFCIYFWIGDPENGRVNIMSDLLFKIWDLFKEHNIEIPFQQTDLHLKTVNRSQFENIFSKRLHD